KLTYRLEDESGRELIEGILSTFKFIEPSGTQ
ncbi:MAG: hypothetical protein G01um101433_1099, partial [Parcubacteria group bacterium Gr01-1014_33]